MLNADDGAIKLPQQVVPGLDEPVNDETMYREGDMAAGLWAKKPPQKMNKKLGN
jgi:hypothetical protein